MEQNKQPPEVNTNVPQDEPKPQTSNLGLGAQGAEGDPKPQMSNLDVEPGGPADLERELQRQENESAERSREARGATGEAQENPTTLRTGEKKPSSTIDRLNEFLRGELASVETYELALHAIKDHELTGPLRQIRDSHERRVGLLRDRIRALGGEPAHSSGVWGAFARAIQRGADLLGHRVALAALEEGEEQSKKRYTRDLEELSPAEREFVEKELMTEQARTIDLARSLQKFVKAA